MTNSDVLRERERERDSENPKVSAAWEHSKVAGASLGVDIAGRLVTNEIVETLEIQIDLRDLEHTHSSTSCGDKTTDLTNWLVP